MWRTALLAPVLLAGCASTTVATPREGPVGLGQTAYIDGPKVRPIRVIEDSRCPANVHCIWAGRLVLRAAVITGPGTREMDLTLGTPEPVADGMLTLVSVTPERNTNAKLKSADYRFAFEFSGGL